MKILFILPEYLPESGGGIISYYEGILPNLVESGNEIHVLVVHGDRMDLPDREIDGVRICYLQSKFLRSALQGYRRYHLTFPTLWAFLPFAWAAFEQARHGAGFDLVETTDFSFLFAPWIVSADAPPVNVSLHGSCGQLEWYEHPGTWNMNSDIVRLVERAAFSAAGALQANSANNAGFWKEMTHRDVRVLLPTFSFSEQPIIRPKEPGTGVVVGRLQIWKGPSVLCQAMEKVPDVRVFWIGKEMMCPESGLPMSKALEKQYPGVFGGRLIHQGSVSHAQILQRIAEASFLCVPSTWDVFNLTVVEAMALGTPVICSIEAGASMLIQHGENGFLFDPSQPTTLAQCIRHLLSLTEKERVNLVARARETVDRMLDPAHLRAERLDYYKTLVSGHQPLPYDEWLHAVLAPRVENGRTEMLQAFTAKELIIASGQKVICGIKRRLSSVSTQPSEDGGIIAEQSK